MSSWIASLFARYMPDGEQLRRQQESYIVEHYLRAKANKERRTNSQLVMGHPVTFEVLVHKYDDVEDLPLTGTAPPPSSSSSSSSASSSAATHKDEHAEKHDAEE